MRSEREREREGIEGFQRVSGVYLRVKALRTFDDIVRQVQLLQLRQTLETVDRSQPVSKNQGPLPLGGGGSGDSPRHSKK